MSTTLSIQEAQEQLPELVARAAQDAEPYYIARNGERVAVLVSLRTWQQRKQDTSNTATAAKAQERHVRVYQKKLKQLGSDYWLSSEQQARLKELVQKDDCGESLSPTERKELRHLLKRHEQLMVKRAAAMQAL